MTPEPIARLPANSAKSKAPTHSKRMAIALLAGGLMLGSYGFYLASHTSPVAEAQLSQSALEARTASFAAASKVTLPRVEPVEMVDALKSMGLPPPEQAKLETEMKENRVKLVWLTLWDDQQEDGDVVEIRSHGFSQNVTLRHLPTKVAIPAPPEGVVNVRGISDGGGGITVAIKSGSSTVLMPVMSVGQTLGIPVAP